MTPKRQNSQLGIKIGPKMTPELYGVRLLNIPFKVSIWHFEISFWHFERKYAFYQAHCFEALPAQMTPARMAAQPRAAMRVMRSPRRAMAVKRVKTGLR